MRAIFAAGTTLGSGGLGAAAYQIARGLQEIGGLARVICCGSLVSDIEKDKIQPINLDWLPRVFHYSLLRRRTDLIIQAHSALFDKAAARFIEECDIFYGMNHYSLNSMQRAREMGAKIILDNPNSHILNLFQLLEEEGARYGLKHSYLSRKSVQKVVDEYEQADYVRLLSSYAYETFVELGVNPERLVVIPPGIDLNRFYPRQKADDIFRICLVGSFTLRKGFQYLLEALDELKLENCELIMDGGSGDRVCKKMVREYQRKINLKVICGDPVNTYARSSLLVLPSIEDGFALVVTEAMACGLPVIITENTGAKDAVREGVDGFVVPIRDVEALKEKILFLYEHEDIRQKMGRSAAEQARRYSVENVVAELGQFIRGVA